MGLTIDTAYTHGRVVGKMVNYGFGMPTRLVADGDVARWCGRLVAHYGGTKALVVLGGDKHTRDELVSAALGSLKGPKHGGANYKVVQMFEDMKREVSDPTDESEVTEYLKKLLRREAFDRKGLIYGVGHAVYSVSDPRAQVFKSFVGQLAHEKGRDADFALYQMVERLAPAAIAEERRIYKGVSVNVDFYSGFVYSMLGLPPELYTPVFAIARIVGWSAHRLEELVNTDKIIRPAYRCVREHEEYTPLRFRE